MARIRNIKPDTWTDEKFMELSFQARLLFIGLWNFADREGRMVYSPRRIKAQIFPSDSLDVVEFIEELKRQGMIMIYRASNERILSIPSFKKHQFISAREPQSILPASGVVSTVSQDVLDEADTTPSPVSDQASPSLTPVREDLGHRTPDIGHLTSDTGKSISVANAPQTKGTRLSGEWWPDEELKQQVRNLAPSRDGPWFRNETEKFRDYWIAKAGKDGRKLDWAATYRNWIRKANENGGGPYVSKAKERTNGNRKAILAGLGLAGGPGTSTRPDGEDAQQGTGSGCSGLLEAGTLPLPDDGD